MTDLADFLRARYADHRSAALGAKGDTDGRWTQDDGPPEDIVLYDKSGKLTMGQHRHIARHDPAFVLADLDAKLRIVAEHSNDGGCCTVCAEPETFDDDAEGNREWTRYGKPYPCRTLRLLASPFAQHPDYLESWRL